MLSAIVGLAGALPRHPDALPPSIDWTLRGVVPPVKDQGPFGTAVVLPAIAAVESALSIATTKPPLQLSVEELIDCHAAPNPGPMSSVFSWMSTNGCCTASDYPSSKPGGPCNKDKCQSAVKVGGFKTVPKLDEDALAVALQNGPVLVAVDAGNAAFQMYRGGVLRGKDCGTQLDHALLLVGYGNATHEETGQPTRYWKLQNSWGATWGEEGYLRLERGTNACGVALDASYPTGVEPAAAEEKEADGDVYELFYTASELDGTNALSHAGRRLQMPSIHYWLASASFDSHGTPIKPRRNVTAPQKGMGYLSVSPDGKHALFATERKMPQGWSNVDTFIVPTDGSSPPTPFLKDQTPLLQPCLNFTPPCTQASTFHATYSPDGKTVVFSYRAWSSIGVAKGSQALAVADAATGAITKLLTYDFAAVGTQDMCPTLLPKAAPELVVFVRSLEGGFKSYLAIVNTTSGYVQMHDDWPEVGDGSGCPAPRSEEAVMYLGCADPPCDVASSSSNVDAEEAIRWGVAPPRPQSTTRSGKSGWAQLSAVITTKVQQRKPAPMFKIGLTTAPGYVGVFETSQCDRIWGDAKPANDTIVCQGADPEHLFFLKHFVNTSTGVASRNDTTTLKHVMTPKPYALWHHASGR